MVTLLVATEGGEGLGHVAPWACLVNQALARGWQVHMASPQVGQIQQLLGGDARLGIWQAPVLGAPPAGATPSPKSWPELLLTLGYGDATQLSGVVKAWVNLLKHLAPTVVMADYAPALILAARVAGVPCVEAGIGFCVPPWEDKFQRFPGVKAVDGGALMSATLALGASFNTALRASGYQPGMADVSELGSWPVQRIVTSIPQMDVYGERSGIVYSGFLGGSRVADGAGPTQAVRVFGYLKPRTPGLHMLIDQLCEAGVGAYLAIPDGMPPTLQQRGCVTVVNHVVDLPRALKLVDVYLSNGGMHGVGQALAVGCWPVVVPMQAEQVATARNLVMRQWGTMWLPDAGHKQGLAITDALRRRATGPSFNVDAPSAEDFMLAKLEPIIRMSRG